MTSTDEGRYPSARAETSAEAARISPAPPSASPAPSSASSPTKSRGAHAKEPAREPWRFDLALVSTYRAPIYGICIFWIVFFHAYAMADVDYSFGNSSLAWLALFMEHGNVGVDVFLFLSGISLYFSWQRDPSLRNYYVKRLVRLFVPVIVIDGLYWFIRCVVLGQLDGISGFIRRITLTSMWTGGSQSTWYVELLLPLYLVYPLIHELIYADDSAPKTALRAAVLIGVSYLVIYSFWNDEPELFDVVEIALSRIPVFLLGCALGRTVYCHKKLPAWCAALPFVGAFLFFYVLSLDVLERPFFRFFYLVGGVSLAYAFALVFLGVDKLVHKVGLYQKSLLLRGLSQLGGASLELYLAHITLIQIYQLSPWYTEGGFVEYLPVAALAIVVALVASKLIVAPLSKRLIATATRPKKA